MHLIFLLYVLSLNLLIQNVQQPEELLEKVIYISLYKRISPIVQYY